MTVEALAKLVSQMRTAQKEYFRSRSDTNLEEAKRLERKVDQECGEILDNTQRKLFQ